MTPLYACVASLLIAWIFAVSGDTQRRIIGMGMDQLLVEYKFLAPLLDQECNTLYLCVNLLSGPYAQRIGRFARDPG